MNCYDTRRNNNNNNNNNAHGYTIGDILKRLDKMQREAMINTAADGCENCRLASMYNTKPINLYTKCRQITATIGVDGETTALFRVEAVRDDETVVLRLLQNTDGAIVCTSYTIIVNINCICYIQCFEPINCDTACYTVM